MAKRKDKRSPLTTNHLVIKEVEPLTDNQSLFFDNYESGKSQVLLGYAGVGKTYLALYKALQDISDPTNNYRRVVIVRSAVPSRDLGAMPGTLEQKTEMYELPYISICNELFGRGDAYQILKKQRTIEFISTSYIRGITLDNTIVIADEIQNMTAHEAESILTRIGIDSKIVFCGDILQRDITKHSEKNIELFLNIIERMVDDFDFVSFTEDDVVRSDLVGSYIKTKAKLLPQGY
jgi:phosphate starvation-inducible PhoH-like protein